MVSKAIQAFADGDYQKAYELSGDALVTIDRLSGDYIPAAWYYLAKSRVQILRLAMESGDQEKLQNMQNALIESYFDYKEALKTADHQLQQDIMADLQALYNPILQTGLSALNTGNDPNQPFNVRESAYQAAKGYLGAAYDISPTYLACDLYGQALLANGDSEGALGCFKESIRAYKEKPPTPPDFLMAYVYYRKADIERFSMNNILIALKTLQNGQTLLNSELSRQNGLGNLNPADREKYEKGMMDLINFELDIYRSDTIVRDEAMVRFQEVMIKYPENYDIHIAYAGFLEDIDPLLAIDAYETAISIDESNFIAYFNMGAVYNNMGTDFYMSGLNVDDEAVADSLYNEANNNFRNSYRYLEASHRLNPYDLMTVQALIQLANVLGLEEQAEIYKQKAEALKEF
jgi:tetratricopeptide (TPR) repeat protein